MDTDTAITAMDTVAAAIITDGTGAAVITSGATTTAGITGKFFARSAVVIHCPDDRLIAATRTVASMRRGRFSGHLTADGAQPNPISTAIRIRSE